jgi:hypothetical protein
MFFDAAIRSLDPTSPKNVPPKFGFLPFQPSLLWFATLGLAMAAAGPQASGEEKHSLAPANEIGDLQQVKVVIEVRGQLKLNPDGKKVSRRPVEVKGELLYDEKQLAKADGLTQHAARYYRQAKAAIRVGDDRREEELTDLRRLVVVDTDSEGATFFSPFGPMEREELELIDVQGSRLRLSALLPNETVAPGDSWTHEHNVLSLLLGLDVVSQADVKSTFRRMEGDLAIVEMAGSVNGAVGGVASVVKLEAKYNFDVGQRRITWLAMSLQENRSIGHAEPGFEVTARVRMAAAAIEKSEPLRDSELAELPLEANAGAELISFQSEKGAFRLLHDRRWRVLIDRHDVTIMRFVDRGDLIAQCNMSKLSDLPAGKQMQLGVFQKEIRRALGKAFSQFTEASQSVTDRGLRVLRVVATGTVSELPIQWTYYHVSDDKGRRVSYVFTMESKLAEQFAGADGVLISSLEFAEADQQDTAEAPASDEPVVTEAAADRASPSEEKRLRR